MKTARTRLAVALCGVTAIAAGIVLANQAAASKPTPAPTTDGTAATSVESPAAVNMHNWTETNRKGGTPKQ